MDVYEDEKSYLRKDLKGARTGDEVFDKSFFLWKNVDLHGPHCFYTERAIYNMIETTVENLLGVWDNGKLCSRTDLNNGMFIGNQSYEKFREYRRIWIPCNRKRGIWYGKRV